jgi:DNA repair protein RadC
LIKSKLRHNKALTSPNEVKDFCRYSYAHLEHEVFGILFLNSNHELITSVELFRGSVNCAYIYPREVLKEVLKYNASAVIFAHNHPSSNTTPSQADIDITQKLIKLLKLVDVKVLDHIIVGLGGCSSFAELGLL